MEIKKKLGKHIQKLRIKRNLKQSELAELVNIATKTQSCVETGKNFPSAELLERYAKAFQIDISDILDINCITPQNELLDKIQALLQKASDEEITLIYKIVRNIVN